MTNAGVVCTDLFALPLAMECMDSVSQIIIAASPLQMVACDRRVHNSESHQTYNVN